MADAIADIFAGLKSYFTPRLTANDLMVAFPDERGGEPERTYPIVSITIVDAARAADRRYGGVVHTQEDSPDGKTATLTKTPIPIQLFFQLDTFAERQIDDWVLAQEIMALIESNPAVPTPNGNTVYPSSFSATPLDHLEDGLFRKGYRFKLTAWFNHPDQAEQVYLMLESRLNIENKQMSEVYE